MKQLILFLGALLASPAPAALVLTIDGPTQTGAPGSTVTFSGSLSNTGPDEIFLTTASLFTPPDLGNDISPFFLNAEPYLTPSFSLLAGASTPLFALFDILIPIDALPGTYATGNDFSLFGGLAFGDADLLASADFTVEVTAVPEPGTFLLSAMALALAGHFVRRRQRA